MGIDYDSQLVFGKVFSEEDMKKIVDKVNQDGEFLYEEHTFDMFPNIIFEHAYPYPYGNPVYFITLVGPNVTLEQLTNALANKHDEYKRFLEYFEIDYTEPIITSLPHIW